MPSGSTGIVHANVFETPVAVIDFETTGLYPGSDRVVEVSIVRVDPGKPPELVLDTLVNPQQKVTATEIHGITDDDVADAPTFNQIVADFVDVLSGAVVAAYNVYFDIKFMDYELRKAGITRLPPHICLMYMRPMLGLGKRCALTDACCCFGIENLAAHEAAGDAMASAQLLKIYYDEMKKRGIAQFKDLARLKRYKFIDSFSCNMFESSMIPDRSTAAHHKPRRGVVEIGPVTSQISEAEGKPIMSTRDRLAEYWDCLKAALSDLEINDAELQELDGKKRKLNLRDEEVRMLHARLFAGIISQFTGDKWLDAKECEILHRVHSSLSRLGWAPGEPVQSNKH